MLQDLLFYIINNTQRKTEFGTSKWLGKILAASGLLDLFTQLIKFS